MALDSSPVGPFIARSGSRLKLSWYETADGTRVPTQTNQFYDSARAENCTVFQWASGDFYCTPFPTNNTNSNLLYQDSACTMPLFREPGAPAQTYYIDIEAAGCDNHAVVQQLLKKGALVTPPATLWTKVGNTCGDPQGSGPPNAFLYYSADAVVAATDLVNVTTAAAGTGGLQSMKWQTPDGLLWPLPRGYDATISAECTFQDESATSASCSPAQQFATNFGAVGCTVPKLAISNTACALPTYVSEQRAACPHNHDHRLFALGGATTPSPLYDNSCQLATPSAGANYYLMGAQNATAQTLTRAPVVVSGQRLEPIFLNSTDLNVWDYVLFDPSVQAECGFTYAPDSTLVCAPQGPTSQSLFSDVGCTQPVDVITIRDDDASCGSSLSPVPKFAWKSLGGSPATFEIHQVGAQHTTTLYSGAPGTCDPYDVVGPRFYDLVPTATPWGTFQAATIVTDP